MGTKKAETNITTETVNQKRFLVNGVGEPEESGAGTPGDSATDSPTKCILNNNKLEERKR